MSLCVYLGYCTSIKRYPGKIAFEFWKNVFWYLFIFFVLNFVCFWSMRQPFNSFTPILPNLNSLWNLVIEWYLHKMCVFCWNHLPEYANRFEIFHLIEILIFIDDLSKEMPNVCYVLIFWIFVSFRKNLSKFNQRNHGDWIVFVCVCVCVVIEYLKFMAAKVLIFTNSKDGISSKNLVSKKLI